MCMLCGYSRKRRERELRNHYFFPHPVNPETVSSRRDSDTEEADLPELHLPGIHYWWIKKADPPPPQLNKQDPQQNKQKPPNQEPEFVNVQSVLFNYVFCTGMGKEEILKGFCRCLSWIFFPKFFDIFWEHFLRFVYVWTSVISEEKVIIWCCDWRTE